MANGFTTEPQTKNDVSRNVWDWTHSNNLTTEIGRLTPCFCRRVPAGTSLSIKSDFALKFMPMQFPIQTQLKARLNFFKMPVRALWKGYKDWISSVNMKASDGSDINSKHVPPHISIQTDPSGDLYSRFDDFFGTGSDLDYLGLPTTFDSTDSKGTFVFSGACMSALTGVWPDDAPEGSEPTGFTIGSTYTCRNKSTDVPPLGEFTAIGFSSDSEPGNISSGAFTLSSSIPQGSSIHIDLGTCTMNTPGAYLTVKCVIGYVKFTGGSSPLTVTVCSSPLTTKEIFNLPDSTRPLRHWEADFVNDLSGIPEGTSPLILFYSSDPDSMRDNSFIGPNTGNVSRSISFVADSSTVSAYTPETCPWYNNITKQGLKVSSLPLRMREAVYNAYIRNIKNNPLVVDGIPRYNDWVLAYDKDGDDSFNYFEIANPSSGVISGESSGLDYFYGRKYVNWEPDWLTTAVPEPQQGQAPLVGLTTYASVVSTDENGANTMKLNSVLTDEDGNNYAVNYISDKEGLKNVTYTELSATDALGKPLANMYQAVSNGISITDLRNVNAYMRYLELNMRRGYSYKDIIEGRYDVNVRYDELMMPEFLGGFTRNVAVAPITQTVQTSDTGSYEGALGSQSGDAFVAGQPDVDINVYCDEDSIVMGFVSVAPVPIYTQTLLSDWLIQDPLDIFSPEFANTGFQPIPLKQVAPIQTFNNGGVAKMDDVFGYQRPWYDLIAMTDQAHGLFRSSLRNFIMYRSWDDVPVLGKDFLLVKPDQVNNVFSVTETTDKIFGQIRFIIKCKNEVSRSIVPRLE